ncbi:phenylacetate--CoA ligase family protein [Propionispora vibrioides]|uniref:Phenylacetate-CoA ligase n=1 Tax=Propionispora vibrioides TaxID=112903 RepID=A0A1H8RDV3_9FIRM|nr:AMP-binding protein [Propionispora vibrioides]SEO64203.1 phenylacetate-CoA ligase [Propionispora vibrioides]
MIAEVIDRTLRRFEDQNCRPAAVKRAGAFFKHTVEQGLRPGFIDAVQELRLRHTLRYVQERSPFYRRLFKEYAIKAETIRTVTDLAQLPFTTAADIRQWRDFLCVPEDRLSAVFTTSGTTGEPKRVYYTFREMQALSNLYGMTIRMVHSGRLVALIALPIGHGLWIGGASVQRAVERAGGLPLMVGADNPAETVTWLKRFSPDMIFSSPSYMTAVTREAQQLGYRIPVGKIALVGERLTAEHKAFFQEYWGAAVFDIYGSTEIGSAQTISLPGCQAFHINDLHLVTEIIDPATGQPAQEGELVFTTLRRDGMPFIRYRSGDRGSWATCPCWLPLRAVHIGGRTDDMIVAGDMNLYGRVIADAVGKVPKTTGRILVRVEKAGLVDQLTVQVEGQPDEILVQAALQKAYPELAVNMKNGNLQLVIEPISSLGQQIKDIRVRDLR